MSLVSVLGVVAPAPRQGILALLDQPTFTIRSLPPVPAGVSGFTALSIDLEKTFDQIVALLKKANPPAADQVPATVEMFRQRFGFDLHRDVLPGSGSQAGRLRAAAGRGARAGPGDGNALSVRRADSGRPGSGRGRIGQIIRSADADRQRPASRGSGPGRTPPASHFVKRTDVAATYVLDLPQGGLPPQVVAMFQPTVTLGNGQLVFAASTDAAQRAIAASDTHQGSRWQANGAFVPMARRLPENLVLLNVSDPRETMPALIENLPALVQQLNGLLLAGLRQAARENGNPRRERAARTRGGSSGREAGTLHVDPAKIPRARRSSGPCSSPRRPPWSSTAMVLALSCANRSPASALRARPAS